MKKTLKKIVKATGLQRNDLAAARMFCERYSLAAFKGIGPNRGRSQGRILCYHSVGQAATGVNDVTPKRFSKQIEFALRQGFRFVPASQIALTGGDRRDLAITFDDAWSSVASEAAPILRGFGLPWTLFVVSSWCDHRAAWARESILSWHAIERLMAMGAEIGSHSVTHPDFGIIGREEMAAELHGSRERIASCLGVAPDSFAIPLGQSMNWPAAAGEIAREAGYKLVYAQAEETRPSGTIARTFVTRFDDKWIFPALLHGAYDRWEEWI